MTERQDRGVTSRSSRTSPSSWDALTQGTTATTTNDFWPSDLEDQVEPLARELWEAHATRRQAVIGFPQLHWDEADASERDHWRALARVALAFARSHKSRL